MRAMILAAGLGTRLRPLTNDRPKALVEINGRTLLEITIARLATFGVREIIVNVHHFAEQVVAYLKSKGNFGIHIEMSREDDLLLDTGGGLKKAAWFFQQDPARLDEPFLLHNVDVLSNIDLRQMLEFQSQHEPLATLAVQSRESSRQLLFDERLQLRGRRSASKNACATSDSALTTAASRLTPLAFSGIHVLSPRILPLLTESGAFSIIDSYLRLSAQAEKILGFHHDNSYWRDLGRASDLAQATIDLQKNALSD